MINNKNYYRDILSHYPRTIPFPHEEPIDLDLHRTFPEIAYFQKEENIAKLKNVLLAFSMRNITIGYCQGFNYIVGKLLLEMGDEEKVFWIFTQIAENYLPFDYYLKFTGVRTDTLIIQKIIKLSRPNLDANIELCISNLITRCFISLFSQNVNDGILFCIWDAFFVYGNITLYRAFLWLVFLIYEKEMNKMSIECIHNAFIEKLFAVTDAHTLNYFLMMYIRINEDFIKHYRSKYFEKTNSDAYVSNPVDKELKCDMTLPFCIFNREGENVRRYRDFNCIRMSRLTPLLEDYFDNVLKAGKKGVGGSEVGSVKEEYNRWNKGHYEEIDLIPIERQRHCCEDVGLKQMKDEEVKEQVSLHIEEKKDDRKEEVEIVEKDEEEDKNKNRLEVDEPEEDEVGEGKDGDEARENNQMNANTGINDIDEEEAKQEKGD